MPGSAGRIRDSAAAAACEKKKEKLNAETQSTQRRESERTAMTVPRWNWLREGRKIQSENLVELGEGDRMNLRRVVLCGLAAVIAFGTIRAVPAWPSGDETSAVTAADAQILTEVREHSEAMQNSEYLGDTIGPRLTGSSQLKQANEWTAAKFR